MAADTGGFNEKQLGQFSQEDILVRFGVEQVAEMVFDGIERDRLVDLLGVFVVHRANFQVSLSLLGEQGF